MSLQEKWYIQTYTNIEKVDLVFVVFVVMAVVVIINTNETDTFDENLFTKLKFMNDHRMTRKLHFRVKKWKRGMRRLRRK